MITVKLNKPEFEYDIHSLIKAFYPGETVRVTAEEKACGEPLLWEMRITYLPECIRIIWREGGDGGAVLPECSFAVDFSDRADTKNRLKQNLYQIGRASCRERV